MYQSETMDAVRDAAESLTREGKVLTTGNPEFPLAVFADTYKVDDQPTNTELPPEEVVAVEEHFDAINQDSTPAEDDTRESIVSNLHTAVAKVQFNTTNVIIPSIKAMHSHYANMQSASCEPEYAVRAWRYAAPHNSATLVNHINTRYTTVRPKDSYRSFQLETQTAEAIIGMMAVNNPHLEQEEVTEWALALGSERIESVWSSLFASGGVVVPNGLEYLSAQAAPFNVDDILVAYLICGHYIDNPVIVPDVSVDVDEWEHTIKVLHEMFGFYLSRAYQRRADAREQGAMILTNEATNPIDTRRAVVVVNGDVFDPWVVAGGDIQAILGAAVENSGVTDVKHLDANAHKFIERWHAVYPLIKQSAIDYSDRQRTNNVVAAFREVSRQDPLKERFTPETERALVEGLRYIRRDDYDNPYKVFSTLICRVYFPESTYLEYLDAIDQFGQDFPKATVRELATQAMISLVAIFQAKQIVAELFMPEINPDGPTEEGGAIDDSGLLALADPEDEGSEEAEVTDMTEGAGDATAGGDGLGDSDAGIGGVDELADGASDTSLDSGVDDSAGDALDTGTDTDSGTEGSDASDADVDADFGGESEEDDPYADLDTGDTESEDDFGGSTSDESETTGEAEEVEADSEAAAEEVEEAESEATSDSSESTDAGESESSDEEEDDDTPLN